MALVAFIVVLFGVMSACIASFAFVVGERPARFESIISDGSHCNNCDKPLRLIDNVPVIGWVINRGKSHCCGQKIPSEYFWGELIMGAIGTALALSIFTNPNEMMTRDHISSSLIILFMANICLAVWWRIRTVDDQYDSFNVYIAPEREKDPIEQMIEDDPKAIYLKSRFYKKD